MSLFYLGKQYISTVIWLHRCSKVRRADSSADGEHFDITCIKAFNPAYGFEYLIRHKTEGWKSLGGVLLAFTGVEALFADLGASSRKAIH
jgi:hypothetical protein